MLLFAAAYILGIREWQVFDTAQVADMQQCTLLYDADGRVYQELYHTERRYYTKLDALPVYVGQAFIAIEDARFYEHAGFDIVRIGGALLADLKSGSFSQGASTITQQLIKLSYLRSDKLISRKVAEILMAIRLEKAYSKEEILELYLNRAYFGSGAYGIQAAAQEYFSIDAAELSPAQAAMLAGLVKSPSGYDPRTAWEKVQQRQQDVLGQMLEQGFLSRRQYREAKQESLEISPHREQTYQYGYYTDQVIQEAAELLTVTYAELMEGGYRIYTYLDTAQQSRIENYCRDHKAFPANADDGEVCQCAAVVLHARHNGIAAMVGGREHTTRLAFNRAVAMRRQPGSAIKPVMVFAPAIEYLDYQTTSLLLDAPEDFLGYTPRNAGDHYRGWITLRDTAAYSVNLPAVKLLNEVGVNRAKQYAATVGIPFTDKDNNLSLALGGFTTGVSPLELAASYMPFASGGFYDAPGTVARIESPDGTVLYERKEAPNNVLSEQTAFLVNSLLQSSVQYGTAKRVGQEEVPLCAKTGTSTYDDASNNKDAWIVAYNPEYIVCCWMGFDNTDDKHYLQKGVTGGTYPADMAAWIFEGIYAQREAPEFEVPQSIAAVKIDTYRMQNNLELRPASADGHSGTEYYKKTCIPRELDPKANQMQVKECTDGAEISFSGSEAYIYALERREMGADTFVLLSRLRGGENYLDTDVQPDKVYVYRLTPEDFYTPQYETLYLYIPGQTVQNTANVIE